MTYQPPGGYPPPPPYSSVPPPVPVTERGGMAVAALILGLLAVFTSPTVVLGVLFGVIAMILGFVAVGRANRGAAGRKGMALAGAVLGILGIVLAALMAVFFVWLWQSADLSEYIDCVDKASNRAAEQVCSDQLDDRLNDVFG